MATKKKPRKRSKLRASKSLGYVKLASLKYDREPVKLGTGIRRYQGELEVDLDCGVIYFHSNAGATILRVCNLPKSIPEFGEMLDVTHMVGASWGGGKPTPFRATGKRTKLVSLACDKDRLHALDEDGRVWRYVPATKDRYAFWSPLTEKRVGEDKP